ncbi:MAG: Anaerobic sulfite reductase subunit A [candidate division BRC1 bacterium ADurb.BinA364]|nr:MAG: Anaerobic sulfite reductase subunit A [candidate division BRC1 bacterium ADurb.BinA364]
MTAMKARFLRTTDLGDFVAHLARERLVIGPREEADYIAYGPIESADQLRLGLQPRRSAKEAFLPQSETLFRFSARGRRPVPAEGPEPFVMIGVPAYDLKGIETLDKVFLTGPFLDSYYAKRRQAGLLIGLADKAMAPSQFYNSFGIDPYEPALCDLHMTEIAGGWLMQPASAAGESIAAGLPEAASGQMDEAKQAAEAFRASQNALVPVREFAEKVKDIFESPVWKTVVDGCINCGACTYVCPTCHCFDIVDETIKDQGRRLRAWDSCMAWKFTMHTSGHNPRTTPEQRIRQRLLHKFQYMNKNLNLLGCTGCGRCVDLCPVNWDIRDAMKRIIEAI